MSEELIPCPFCGSSAEYAYSWIPRSNEIAIRCSGDKSDNRMGCPASHSEQDEQGGYTFSCYGEKYLPDLIKKWNTRPIEDQLKAENEHLQARVQELEIALENTGNLAELINQLEDKKQTVYEVLTNTIARRDERIKELEQERRWIPVSERLPEDNQIVIGWNWVSKMTAITRFHKLTNMFYEYWRGGHMTITMWQPLPQPPKGGE